MKTDIYPDVKVNIVCVHGVYSEGKGLDNLARNLSLRLPEKTCKITTVKYGKLFLTVGRLPFVRKLLSDYVASRLATCTYKYPNAYTVVIAHSFGTYALSRAIKELFNEFRVNSAILFGSVVDRNYDWSDTGIDVFNFVGRKDFVVLSSCLYGVGWSGRYGFKKTCIKNQNVTNIETNWNHNGYADEKNFLSILNVVCEILRKRKLMCTQK